MAFDKFEDNISRKVEDLLIIGSNDQEIESEIDRLVYELYGLTEEEVAIVEGGE